MLYMIQFVAAGTTPIALVSSIVGRRLRWRSGRTNSNQSKGPGTGIVRLEGYQAPVSVLKD